MWAVLSTTRNMCPLVVGMSICKKCMGNGEGKSAKVQQWGSGFFPSVWDVGEETDKRRDGEMGDPVVGNLECKKQAILWENSNTPQGNHGGSTSNIRELPKAVCYSRCGLTHRFSLTVPTSVCITGKQGSFFLCFRHILGKKVLVCMVPVLFLYTWLILSSIPTRPKQTRNPKILNQTHFENTHSE